MSLYILIFVLPLLPLVIFISNRFKSVFITIISFFITCVTVSQAIMTFINGPILVQIGSEGIFQISYKIDYLSAFFIILVNVVVLLSSFYSIGYNQNATDNSKLNLQYISFSILHISMLLVLMIQSFVPFLILWEIMALSSFMLIIYDSKNKEVLRAAINYLVQMHVCMLFLLVAIYILIASTGNYTFDSCRMYFSNHNNFYLFLLFFIGFGMKAGFVPLHTWLPKADSSAPDHIAAVMSAATIKMGIYGILRILMSIKSEFYEIGMLLIIISLITGIYGIINAISQKDMKMSLAFSSIENIGIIGLGLGLGCMGIAVQNFSLGFLGFAGAILHAFNHSLFKSLLFFGTGNIFFQTNTTQMNQLGGVLKKSVVSGTIFLIGCLAICGLPPFNGFVSEFLIYDGIIGELNKGNVSIDVLLLVSLFGIALIGGMAIFNFTRMYGMVFLGKTRSSKIAQIKEVSYLMYVPQIVLIVIILSIAIFSTQYIYFISTVVQLYIPNYHTIPYAAIAPQSQIVILLSFMVFVIVLINIIKYQFSKYVKVQEGPTWGCGYTGETSKMQYTPASFSESFEKLSGEIIAQEVKLKPIEKTEIFPVSRQFAIHTEDIFDENLVSPPISYIQKYIKRFAIFKSGNTQTYVWYAFLFLLVLFLLTFAEII